MKLGRATASAAGIVLVVTLGGCSGGGKTVSAGKPAAAVTEAAGGVPGGPKLVCQSGEGILAGSAQYGSDIPGVATPQEALAADLHVGGGTGVAVDRFTVDSASSDSTRGPVNFVARTNGNIRAIVKAERLPAGGWTASSSACGAFWRTGQ